MNKLDLTETDKAIQKRIKHFLDSDLKNPSLIQSFQMSKLGAKDYLNSKYNSNDYESKEVDAIIKCADYNFSLWHNMQPNKKWDISIYLLSVLGASYAVDDIMHENGIKKYIHPLSISENEEGEIKALKFLFNKYGQPRS